MRLIVRDDPVATAEYVASYILKRIQAFEPTPERPFVLGLPTGSSPIGVYKALLEKYNAGEVQLPFPLPTLVANRGGNLEILRSHSKMS